MKNKRLNGAIVILIMALLLPSCKGKAGAQTGVGSSGGGKSLNSAAELKEYLDKQPANSPDKPIKVAMKANEMMIGDIAKAIDGSGKYVSLDLSGSPLTKIPEGAFVIDRERGCKTLTGIIIPKSVTTIGDAAFGLCISLTSVTIPNSVTSIGKSAFLGCISLASVTIPNSVTSIGGTAFYQCTSLANVTIPESVISFGGSAFGETAWLNNQPDGLVYVGKVALKYKGDMPANTSINIKDGTKVINDYAFYNCKSLTSVIIPNSVTSIGEGAFEYCMRLTSVTIPNSVTSIGSSAFRNCKSLTSITIPNSVTSIGEETFSYFADLTSVTFQGTIASDKLNPSAFGFSDLRAKYLAGGGGPGTYTRTNGSETWTKQ